MEGAFGVAESRLNANERSWSKPAAPPSFFSSRSGVTCQTKKIKKEKWEEMKDKGKDTGETKTKTEIETEIEARLRLRLRLRLKQRL